MSADKAGAPMRKGSAVAVEIPTRDDVVRNHMTAAHRAMNEAELCLRTGPGKVRRADTAIDELKRAERAIGLALVLLREGPDD